MASGGELIGQEALRASIARIREEIRARAVRAGVRAAAEVVQKEIEERAPILDAKTAKSTALEPGSLKADIGIEMQRTDPEGLATALIGPGEKTRHVGSWVELGHRLVKGGYSKSTYHRETGAFLGYRGRGKVVGDVPAHPFVRPAWEAAQEAANKACDEKIWAAIEKELK